MSDTTDLRTLLESWPYDPDHEARLGRGADGREILQVRTPLGLEQYELEGRPDGLRPHGKDSALDFQLQQLAEARAARREAEFKLSPGDCAELFHEGTLYYFRYLRLFQLKDWPRTIRDTARNLRLFDFVNRYAARAEDRLHLEQWRPYLMRINAAASALMDWENNAHHRALRTVNDAIERIEALDELDEETFQFERERSLQALREMAAQIQKTKPVSELETLERLLQRAIEGQEFERAAGLRERIRELRARGTAGKR
jgi:hypothetical protein